MKELPGPKLWIDGRTNASRRHVWRHPKSTVYTLDVGDLMLTQAELLEKYPPEGRAKDMSEIVIYQDKDPSERLYVKLREGDLQIGFENGPAVGLSRPLSDEQLRVMATALVIRYFERTKKVVWPVTGPMLEHYEKEQCLAEDALLQWMKNSPAEENSSRAPAYEKHLAERRGRRLENWADRKKGKPGGDTPASDETIDDVIPASDGEPPPPVERNPRRRVD